MRVYDAKGDNEKVKELLNKFKKLADEFKAIIQEESL